MKSLRRSEKVTAQRRGVLAFEWILLISLLVIGVIGGLAAVRNSLLSELNDLDQSLNQLHPAGSVVPKATSQVAGADVPWWQSSLPTASETATETMSVAETTTTEASSTTTVE